MWPVMWRVRLPIHAYDDTKEAAEFRHWNILLLTAERGKEVSSSELTRLMRSALQMQLSLRAVLWYTTATGQSFHQRGTIKRYVFRHAEHRIYAA